MFIQETYALIIQVGIYDFLKPFVIDALATVFNADVNLL